MKRILKSPVILSIFIFVVAVMIGVSVSQATTMYTDRTPFLGQLGTVIVDDYSNPAYNFLNSNAYMSGVLGETDYTTTGHLDWNLVVSPGEYCSGCNGSFLLGFTTTSVGDASGVFGAGFDINTQWENDYYVYVTFGDDSTGNYPLNSLGFFGLTSDLAVKSIHVGLSGGGSTFDGYIQIDNLTIGSRIPEPATLLLLGSGLVGLGLFRKKFKK